VDTTTAHGALVFGVFALIAEYEAALIRAPRPDWPPPERAAGAAGAHSR
jgi:hypothetical protein